MKKMFLYILLAVQVFALVFAGNILSPLLSPETGDLIGIAFLSPFVIVALGLVLILGVGILLYAKFKKISWLKIIEIVFLLLDIMLAIFFVISMKII